MLNKNLKPAVSPLGPFPRWSVACEQVGGIPPEFGSVFYQILDDIISVYSYTNGISKTPSGKFLFHHMITDCYYLFRTPSLM